MTLTTRRAAFVLEYLKNGFNGKAAAVAAGYGERGASRRAAELLKQPAVKAEIRAEMEAQRIGARAVLARLAEHARASLDDFLTDGPTPTIDIERARARGALHLAKKYKCSTRRDKRGNVVTVAEIELHDAQAALVHIGRAHKLFTDRVQVDDWRSEAMRDGFTQEQVSALHEQLVKTAAAALAGDEHEQNDGTGDG